jgi:hypothetical protein
MRSLLIFGIIGLFIACSFVPPSQASLVSLSKIARSEMQSNTQSALFGTLPNSKDLTRVASLLSAIASNPDALKTVKKTGGVIVENADQQLLKSTASLLQTAAKDSLPSPKKVVKTLFYPKTHPSKEWMALIKKEEDPTRKQLLEIITQAESSKNIRLCHNSHLKDKSDFFALCLARVTMNSGRCQQMKQGRSMVYKNACLAEYSQ